MTDAHSRRALLGVIPGIPLLGVRAGSAGPGNAPAPPGVVNAKDFGAVGDGAADDYAAITAASLPAFYSGLLNSRK